LGSVSFLFMYPGTLILSGLDIGRYHWTQSYSIIVQISAIFIFVLGLLLATWAEATNKFFSTFVRIQEDRNHQVVSQGPYKYIRHPGYAGTILSAIALPLALGSFYGLMPAFIGSVGFVVRTALEDRELVHRLAGYDAYALKARYRLLPGVW
jgi:protein-S-isoprenylcysteine O-methyltransferase Ste14